MEAALLDTDMLNEVLKRRNPHVVQHATAYLRQHSQFAVSAITRYELLRRLKDAAPPSNSRGLSFSVSGRTSSRSAARFSTGPLTCGCWLDKAVFRRTDADLIIAATSVELNRVLVTGNTAHFSWVPSLALANWRNP